MRFLRSVIYIFNSILTLYYQVIYIHTHIIIFMENDEDSVLGAATVGPTGEEEVTTTS